jgi:hypothetical protein
MIVTIRTPSLEERERDYDSFRIDDRRFDALSFDEQPFSLSVLDHHWVSAEEMLGALQVITYRKHECRLAKTKDSPTAYMQSNILWVIVIFLLFLPSEIYRILKEIIG